MASTSQRKVFISPRRTEQQTRIAQLRGRTGIGGASCSRATRLSVRAVSNGHEEGRERTNTTWKSGGLGTAAYGMWGSTVEGVGNPYLEDYDISFNSTRAENMVERTGTGRYKITIPGLGRAETTANGVAHVQAVVRPNDNLSIGLGVKRICTIINLEKK